MEIVVFGYGGCDGNSGILNMAVWIVIVAKVYL